jgi:transcriptional regulator with XRE-family HTH domain
MILTTKQELPDIVETEEEEMVLVPFLRELMQRRHRLPSQLAADLGVSHPTIGRWLSGEDTPSTSSCLKLAQYSGLPLEKILAMAGHLPRANHTAPTDWPEFREYAHRKYPAELDDDVIDVIEELIERRRSRSYVRQEA